MNNVFVLVDTKILRDE